MRISVAFDVKNYVEVMESWPITRGDMTFFLEREDNLVKKVVLTFSNVDIKHAPKITPAANPDDITGISINGGVYAQLAIQNILNWQAVVTGQQIFDLDFDTYELRFHAENINEESQIHLKSWKSPVQGLNSSCDFEQIGRAFCVGNIPAERIEYTSHYREGRLAFEVGRNVDAYNNMFLFLETRYCDGKTKTVQQIELLADTPTFVESLESTTTKLTSKPVAQSIHLQDVFDKNKALKDRIKCIVNLRGKLRHHSLKSPHRWDPNKQSEFEAPARFLSMLVADIVIKESLKDIYAPENLKTFRDLSVEAGFESEVEVNTYRIQNKRPLALKISLPTTVISSKFCLSVLRGALEACEKDGQIADTTRFDALHQRNELDLFDAELGLWAFTEHNKITLKNPTDMVRCRFEHFQSGIIVKHEFDFPVQGDVISIGYAWTLLKYCFDRIEKIDPTTRIMNLKLFLEGKRRPILTYHVAAQVKN